MPPHVMFSILYMTGEVMSIAKEKKMELVMPKLSERLKILRKAKKVKQEEIANFLDCSVRQYQRMEYGEVNVPALTVIALADYFDVSTDYLLGRTDEPK